MLEPVKFLERAREELYRIANRDNLLEDYIRVVAGPLSPNEAIGTPIRRDFPLLAGKEVIVEAEFRGSYGQAFTSAPCLYEDTLNDILKLPLSRASNRAIILSTFNAVASHLKIADRVRHCKDEEPEECAQKIVRELTIRFKKANIGMIGYQPAILENLATAFGSEQVRCTDLNPDNTGTKKFGVMIGDGVTDTTRLIDWCNLLLVTGSTLANDTFDAIYRQANLYKKKIIMFGITGATICSLFDIERLCFYGH